MGYVLPVQTHHYQDYQKRVTKEKAKPFYINKANKVVFDTKYYDLQKKLEMKKMVTTGKKVVGIEQDQLEEHDDVYATVTGKGRNIDAQA
ncbi:hypothetical protein [Oceanobacillus halotolerans]|uniref:hypothetical protein n=1 Tax=Oceanobacillus halotolerans TaxID=2663380 RepID=UPI0013DAEE31|nr:hypothetical protein [Oceanobacillus halotolerans]